MEQLQDRLRRAIDQSTLSRYAISQRSGVSQGQLSRFIHEENGLSVDNLEAVANAIGFEVIMRRKRRKRKGT